MCRCPFSVLFVCFFVGVLFVFWLHGGFRTASQPSDASPFASHASLSQSTVVHVLESEHAVQVPFATAGQDASQPFVAFASSSNLLAAHVIAVQLLEEAHAEHVPPATSGHPASQPSVALPLRSYLLALHATAAHVLEFVHRAHRSWGGHV